MRVAVRKLDGVDSVEVSLERATAEIRLRPDNHVTLAQLRKIIKDNGFSPREASVTVVGTLVDSGGKPALNVTGLSGVWTLASAGGDDDAYKDAIKRVKTSPGGPVEVTGTVAIPASGGQPEALTLQSLKPATK